MAKIKIGDVVRQRSNDRDDYSDILYKVCEINNVDGKNVATVRGVCYRVELDIPEEELEAQPEKKVKEYWDNFWRIADNNAKNANVHS